MKKFFYFVVAMFIGFSCLVSCGDNGSDPEPTPVTPTDTTKVVKTLTIDSVSRDMIMYKNQQLMRFFFFTSNVQEVKKVISVLGNDGTSAYIGATGVISANNDTVYASNEHLQMLPGDVVDKFTITGSFDVENTTYQFEYSGIVRNTAYDLEGTRTMQKESDQNFQYTSGSYTISGGTTISVTLSNSDYDKAYLRFFVRAADANRVIPATDYSLSFNSEAGKAQASVGYVNGESAGLYSLGYSFVGLYNADGEFRKLWFLTSGTIKVSQSETAADAVKIEGNVKSYYGTAITFFYEGVLTQESESASKPAYRGIAPAVMRMEE